MTEQQCLADKILAELPEELAATTSFKVDAKGTGLVMDFAVKLDKADYPLVLGVVKKFNGDFINQKDSEGKDHGCFFIPKLRPAADPAPQAAAEAKEEKPVEVKQEVPKQPSPVMVFADNYCSVCIDFGVKCSCVSNSEYRTLCLKVLKIQLLQQLNANLEKLGKHPLPLVKVSESAKLPEAPKVERSTRPTEGHQEGDIIWIYAENQKGERYEKALENDNQRSNGYFALKDQIIERVNAGKKGLELGGEWLWLSDRDDYIGRKVAKQFPKGARR
jgi:hypothetical protein